MGRMLNEHFDALGENYLFSRVAKRVEEYRKANPDGRLLRHDIGDVTLPLCRAAAKAMSEASLEMGRADGVHGYPPTAGYDFLRQAIGSYYTRRGIAVCPDDIFVSDGAKNDIGSLSDLFGDVTVLLPEPSYPVYRDINVMSGRRIVTLPSGGENGFLPLPTAVQKGTYLIYLCSPANPTGAVYTNDGLSTWVNFARETGSVILFDAAYEAYIRGGEPRSVYEIEGADKVAIEVGSLSKSAGFTGVRVSWTIVPSAFAMEGVLLRERWARRQATKFNGVSYVTSRGAEAALSEEGIAEWQGQVTYYLENASLLAGVLREHGVEYCGGESSPYLFLRCPHRRASWDFFEELLNKTGIVGTPGVGFGESGEGYLRLSAFADCRETARVFGAFLDGLL